MEDKIEEESIKDIAEMEEETEEEIRGRNIWR